MPDFKVSVDPGKWGCGVAIWYCKSTEITVEKTTKKYALLWAGYVKNWEARKGARVNHWLSMAEFVKQTLLNHTHLLELRDLWFVMEIPQVYESRDGKDPNDLIDLAGVQGAILGATGCSADWSPLPREWKGQLPKGVSEKRVESKLSESEKKVIEWPGKKLDHNVYDTLHLGLVYLERNNLR